MFGRGGNGGAWVYQMASDWAHSAYQANQSKKAFGRAAYLSENAHQIETKDLYKAGLNPILSANSGINAVAPIVGNANHNGMGGALSGSAAKQMADVAVDKLEAEKNLLNAEAKRANADAEKSAVESLGISATTSKTNAERQKFMNDINQSIQRFGLEQEERELRLVSMRLDAALKAINVNYEKRLDFTTQFIRDFSKNNVTFEKGSFSFLMELINGVILQSDKRTTGKAAYSLLDDLRFEMRDWVQEHRNKSFRLYNYRSKNKYDYEPRARVQIYTGDFND